MCLIQNILNKSKDIHFLCNRLTNLTLPRNAFSGKFLNSFNTQNPIKIFSANIHSTVARYDLMEFFDDKKNWAKREVRSGRSWRLDDLRIKSNSDLHKLWYVLLKERNMLMTMEHEANEQYEPHPNPERIDKVQDSMNNIETVVRERNKAYYLLETGVDGERPARRETSILGLPYFYRCKEHFIPQKYNRRWNIKFYNEYLKNRDVETFLQFYREKMDSLKRRAIKRSKNHCVKLLTRFPHLDRTFLQKRYPDVNIAKIDAGDRARGHFAPKYD